MQNLAFPALDAKITKQDDKYLIWDTVRKKSVVLTPEEWVRQHLVSYLVKQLGYPAGLLSLESGMKYDRRRKRSDVLVYERAGGVFLLAECKAPHIKLSQNTLHQAFTYAKVLRPQYLLITNGLLHFVYRCEPNSAIWHPLDHFPEYPR